MKPKQLVYSSFTGTQNLVTLDRLLGTPSPISIACGDRFGEAFAQHAGVRRQAFWKNGVGKYCEWTVEVEFGELYFIAPQRIIVDISDKVVKYDFASQLVDGLNECLEWFEAYVGPSGSVPECQNPEHGEISRLVTEPECVPDGDAWTCLGCGWRVNAAGLKLTRKLFPDENQVPARKAGQKEQP